MADSQLIGMALGAIATAALAAGRALNRRHTIDKGTYTQARVLNAELVDHSRVRGGERFLLIQLAIPRPDGTEITAVARADFSAKPPQPGWTVPVSYLERLGTTTKVEITGPARP